VAPVCADFIQYATSQQPDESNVARPLALATYCIRNQLRQPLIPSLRASAPEVSRMVESLTS